MTAAMQIYGAFALLMIAIIAIIVLFAIVSKIVSAVRRRLDATGVSAKPRAHDDFGAPASRSRSAEPSNPGKPRS